MASSVRKIGALIALDGAQKFKDDVTSCNKSLSSMKSELSLVRAQYEGQANTLEALTKKQEVLNKILDEQKKKEEATRAALNNAKESYKQVGEGLEKLTRQQQEQTQKVDSLKAAYEEASKQLQAMTKAGDSSEQSIRQQEEAVQNLEKQLEDEKKALEEIDKAIKNGNKNYQTASNRIKDWETKLHTAEAQTIRATSAVNQNAAYLREAEQAADGCAKSIDQYGKEVKEASKVTVDFGTIVKTNLVNTATNAAKQMAAETASAMLDMESAQRQFQAATGATNAEMLEYKSVMDSVYSSGYGSDIQDVADSMALVKQYVGEIDSSTLEDMTKNGLAMQDVFGMDLSETIRGVDALMENMGVTSEEAFDLMAAGAQKGLDKSGELADNITEYSSLWGQAGFSAQEMFAIMDNGLSSGAYNLDKVNDFVKEFSISLADGRIEENLSSFSIGTQNLFRQWHSGEATTKQVFQSVINDLASMENQQEALTIASNTWSSLGEDNSMKVITSLNKVNTAYDNVEGTMESINSIKYDTVADRVQTLGRKFQTELAEPLAEDVLPVMEEGLDFLIENIDGVSVAIVSVGAGVATFKAVSTAVTLFSDKTKIATAAMTAFNAVTNANPIVLVATAVAAAGTAIVAYASSLGEASAEARQMADANQKVCDSANEVAAATGDMITEHAENQAQMEAEAQYADRLAGKIEELAGKENKSNAEKQVMRGYISELNRLVPNLNLAYDEQADSLNLSNEAIEKQLALNEEQVRQQAALEYVQELMQKRTELEIESIKIGNEAADLLEERTAMENEYSDAVLNGLTPVAAWVSGQSDVRKSYQELTDAQEVNSEAMATNQAAMEELAAEEEAAMEVLSQYGYSYDAATGQIISNTDALDANSESVGENAEAQQMAAALNSESVQMIAHTYTGMQETLSGVLESQMDMFSEFNSGVEISSERLLENMQSQLDGVSNWAENMAILADRGINEGILEKLMEMGPEGAGYVQAFVEMSDEQLRQAGEMWMQSLDMKSGVEESVQGMLESYTTALNGGQEQVAAAMRSIGESTVQGLVDAVNTNTTQAGQAGQNLGQAAVDGAAEGAGTHSPSWKTAEIGANMDAGLVNGINEGASSVQDAFRSVTEGIVNTAKNTLNASGFAPVGRSVADGIRSGLQAGQPGTVSAAQMMADQVRQILSQGLASARFTSIGAQVGVGLYGGMLTGIALVSSAGDMLRQAAIEPAKGLGINTLYQSGVNVSYGLAEGIRDGRSAVINAVSDMCSAAVSTAKSKLQIHSPSAVFAELGSYSAEGYGVGYEDKMRDVNRMLQESMEIPTARRNGLELSIAGGSTSQEAGGWPDHITLELPIYVGKIYSRTEIVDIALDGISKNQKISYRSKGVRAG